jgi:hypothetical protein
LKSIEDSGLSIGRFEPRIWSLIVEANVTAAPVDHRGMIMGSSKTDSSGAFELRLLAGVSYLIRAGIRTEDGFRQAESVVFVDQQKEGLHLSIRR